jgi:uncharacterized protein YggE
MYAGRRHKGVAATTSALVVVSLALASTTAYFAYRSYVAPSTGYPSGGSQILSPVNAASVLAGVGQAADPNPNSIAVSGSGSVSYIPNEALIRVGAVTENKSAIDATTSNAAVTSKVIKALNAAGVSNSSVQTQGYNLNVDYSSCYNNSTCIPQILGYTVTNSLLVNLTSTDPSQLGSRVGSVIDSAVGAGANQVSLNFGETSSALASLTSTALQHALATASNKAKVIASSLGVSITGVISATDNSNSAPQYNYGYGYAVAGAAMFQGPAAISTPIIPGSQSFTVGVQVVYSIT